MYVFYMFFYKSEKTCFLMFFICELMFLTFMVYVTQFCCWFIVRGVK